MVICWLYESRKLKNNNLKFLSIIEYNIIDGLSYGIDGLPNIK